jgi:hypothetical protein
MVPHRAKNLHQKLVPFNCSQLPGEEINKESIILWTIIHSFMGQQKPKPWACAVKRPKTAHLSLLKAPSHLLFVGAVKLPGDIHLVTFYTSDCSLQLVALV